MPFDVEPVRAVKIGTANATPDDRLEVTLLDGTVWYVASLRYVGGDLWWLDENLLPKPLPLSLRTHGRFATRHWLNQAPNIDCYLTGVYRVGADHQDVGKVWKLDSPIDTVVTTTEMMARINRVVPTAG